MSFTALDGRRRFLAIFAAMLALAVAGSTVVTAEGDAKPSKSKKKKLKKKKKKKKKKKVVQGPAGPQGPQGPPGTPGATGAPGANATVISSNWGVITRNTIGSPVAELRDGPYGSFGVTGPIASPPYGTGSLGIAVKDGTEKVAFGNEVDFYGNPVGNINQIGFRVFQPDENSDVAGNDATQDNLPNITFEVDPNLGGAATGVNYSSLVFIPEPLTNAQENQWSPYLDATATPTAGHGWYFTNTSAAGVSGCSQATPCSFSALKAAILADNTAGGGDPALTSIYSLAIAKGRDNAWVGAVDGLRVNNTVYDFNRVGVTQTTP